MDIRRLMTGLCVFALGTSVSISGDSYRGHYGGACDSDCEGCSEGGEESQGGSNGDGGKDNTDPIYLATGDFQHVQTDLFIPGRGMDFEIKRFYRSKSGIYGRKSTQPTGIDFGWELNMVSQPLSHPPVGMNWTHNYDMRVWMGGADQYETLVPQPGPSAILPTDTFRTSSITVFFGNGRIEEFKLDPTWGPSVDGNGILAEPVEYHLDTYDKVVEFEHTGKPIYLRDSEDTVYQFNPMYTIDYDTYNNDEYYQYAGRLASITDRNGNKISFTYETSAEGDERIATATDTLGHVIEFRYHDDPNSPITSSDLGDQIWQIEDHAGRVVEYGYDATEPLDSRVKLTSVKLPAITSNNDFPLVYVDGASVIDHGRFPQGRTWSYEYTGLAQGGMWTDGLLSKITNPNGVVILENTYTYDLDDIRASGRVIRQDYGGDTYNYMITTDTGDTEFADGYYAKWSEDYYVWVNDRRGAITRFKYSGHDETYTDPVGGPDQPRHLQLLEKTEFSGFVDNPDSQVWAECDSSGIPTSWYTYDSSGAQVALTGTIPGTGVTRTWTPNRRWSNEYIYAPADGSSSPDYTRVVYDDDSTNPLHWKRRLMKIQHSASTSETITEYWYYGSGIGGCGCSGSNFATGYQDGNGNITYREFDSNGNVTKVYHDVPATTAAGAGLTVSSDPTDSMSPIPGLAVGIEEFAYNQWGQIETHTHPGKVALDSQGAEVTHARVDKYVYYTDQNDEANYGRLKQKIVDFGGENLTTEYEYNLIGNVIKVTDPGGDIAKYLYNQEHQLVREQHFASNGTDLFAEEEFYYDANGNLTIREVRNLDGDQSVVGGNKKLTTVHGYDVLNFRTVTSRERDTFTGTISEETDGSRRAIVPVSDSSEPNYNAAFVTQRWEFDENRNLIKVVHGEAASGDQSENVVTYEYDYRDLLVKRTTGDGDAKELIVTASYDEKGRAEQVTIDPSGNTQSQHYEVLYDGFDRVTRVTDPMGNERHLVYDDNHNIVEAYLCGPLDEDTSGGGGFRGHTGSGS